MAQSDNSINVGIAAKPFDSLGGFAVNGTTVIDSSGVVLATIDITASGVTTGTALALDDADALTTGKIANFTSNASGTGTRSLVYAKNDHASATGATVLELVQDSTQRTLFIDHNGATGNAISVDAETTTGTTVDLDVAVLTEGTVLDISNLDAITTGKAIHVDATGVTHTSGILVHIDSAATGITGAGRLFLSDHTGATGTTATLNEFKTAANDESILLALTAASLTTGTVLDFGTTAALTTGVGLKIAHTTSVLADGGSLVRISSSSIDTGGATNGTLLDLRSTAQVAGTLVRLDNVLTTGTGMSIIGTGTMTTTGNLLTLTANSATTAAGLLRVNCNGITDGIGAVITSSATAATATGRLLRVDHTGATSASGAGIVAEVASAATDATTVLRVTASAALAAGAILDVSGAAVTTGTALDIGGLDALTTGKGIYVASNSADTGAHVLIDAFNDHASATGCIPLRLKNDSTGTDAQIINTNGGTTGAKMELYHNPGNSAAADNDVTGRILFAADDEEASATKRTVGQIDCLWTDATAVSYSSRFIFYTSTAAAQNEAMRILDTGALEIDLSSGAGTATVFDDYDDLATLGKLNASPVDQIKFLEDLEYMGIASRKDTGSGWMLNIQKLHFLTIGALNQLNARVKGMESRLA